MNRSRPIRLLIITAFLACLCGLADAVEDTTFPLRLSDLRSTFVMETSRTALRTELEMDKLGRTFRGELTSATEREWRGALWAAGLLQSRDDLTRDALGRSLRAFEALEYDTQRQLLEVVYGAAPSLDQSSLALVNAVANATTSTKLYAMATLARLKPLAGATLAPVSGDVARTIWDRFPDRRSDPILVMLDWDLREGRFSGAPAPPVSLVGRPTTGPMLTGMLGGGFAPGTPVVYSIQRRDRTWPGIALVRRGDGRFVRREDGSVWHISHLARSNSNMPGYITNGNTPQGIFTIIGLGVSRANNFIGKTPFLELKLPFEAAPDEYFRNPALAGTSWTIEMYLGLLPAERAPGSPSTTWRNHFPMREAWYAGEAGRNDILAHGTCIDSAYYVGLPWYPSTPSIGCLTATEMWDEKTGQALMSDQLSLQHAFLAAMENRDFSVPAPDAPLPPQPKGYLVVIELDDRPAAVTIGDVISDIYASEQIPKP